MPKPTFDIIGYRARLGITQADLGDLLHLCGPRHIAAWEAHQRSNGRKEHGPTRAVIAYMELLERLWHVYHRPAGLKPMLRSVLGEKLCQAAPRQKRGIIYFSPLTTARELSTFQP